MRSMNGAGLALGAGAVAFGVCVSFAMRSSTAESDKHPLVAAARQEPMMTMGPAKQGGALSAPLASVLTAQKTDAEIAAVANYITGRFGSAASKLTAKDAADLRGQTSHQGESQHRPPYQKR